MGRIGTRRFQRARAIGLVIGLAFLGGTGAIGAGALASRAASGGPSRLGDGFVQASPTIVADGAAGFDAVWVGPGGLMAAHRSDGAWSPATRLVSRVQGPGDPPRLAAAANGAAVVTWRTSQGQTVYARYRAAARGAWQPLTTLARAGRYGPSDPEAAVDARGDAYVLVGDMLHVHRVNAARWSPPRVLRGPGEIVSLAVTPRGTLSLLRAGTARNRPAPGPGPPYRAALWLQTRTLSGRARTFALGDQGGPPLQGDASPFLYRPVVTTNARGDVLAAWQAPTAPNTWRTRVALLPARSARRPTLVTLRESGLDPALAPGPRGSAFVLWDAAHGNENHDARAATITASGQVQRDSVLAGIGAEPAVAADPRGDVAAIGRTSARPRVFLRPAGRRWCVAAAVGRSSEAAVATEPGQTELLWHTASNAILATTTHGCHRLTRNP